MEHEKGIQNNQKYLKLMSLATNTYGGGLWSRLKVTIFQTPLGEGEEGPTLSIILRHRQTQVKDVHICPISSHEASSGRTA
jgi:hypothetical protein